MTLPIFIVDAFADRPLAGNPAAVCPLEGWLPAEMMQAIAAEMNLSETVFFAPDPDGGPDGGYGIRWFTPTREVELIGHATLAAGYLVLSRLRSEAGEVRFRNGGEEFIVTRDGDALSLEMPALPPREITPPPGLVEALAAGSGRKPVAVLAAKHFLCVYQRAADVAALTPDMAGLARLPLPAAIVTAPADRAARAGALAETDGAPLADDFVSRFFAPANGVPEDPVSGVAHLCLAPYWARRLGRKKLVGRQLSARGGVVRCEDRGDRVRLGGRAALFLEGRITIGDRGATM
jgi:predicted PhzF superfamily epimerase YddE/YHI9